MLYEVITEGGHFDDLPSEQHMRETETPADQPAVTEQPPHVIGMRVGRDIEIRNNFV